MFAKRLKLARQRAGLSLQALSQRMRPTVSAQALSKYERGKMTPSSAVLSGLATSLSVPLDFLMGGPAEIEAAAVWHFPIDPPAKLKAKAQAAVLERVDAHLAIDALLPQSRTAAVRLTAAAADPAVPPPERAADRVRTLLRLGDGPIPSLTAALERHGVWVIELDLPDALSGLSYRADRAAAPPIAAIAVAHETPVERKRSILAGQIVRHTIAERDGAPPPADAVAMAAALLMPRDHLLEVVGQHRDRLSAREVLDLKRYFGVPAVSVLTRLAAVGIISQTTLKHAFRTFAKGWRRTEPEPLGPGEGFAALEHPRHLERAVWRALSEEAISPIRAARLLQKPLSVIERALAEAEAA